MAILSWNANMSVNVGIIDRQHKRLFILINKLHNAMQMGKGNDVLNTPINDLLD